MYIVLNMFHGNVYITWASRNRWNYFVQDLLGVTLPRDFAI